ncbi:hypothetical protein ES703_79450 [subsurface metagenome]
MAGAPEPVTGALPDRCPESFAGIGHSIGAPPDLTGILSPV